ncbi:FkbM family methyltransferase [Aquimarina pacifica]|uniref:FkbM family methyltransferase n=1 Tax=Aquimarina pacifica TaxID=1296415 RepID=UPI000470BB89|nr:FkbM family methyltransferase [Aquimarina pacifica]
MRNFIKKVAMGLINTLTLFIPGKKYKAKFLGRISTWIMGGENDIEYDPKLDMYWLKSEQQYLYMVEKPYYNFSKKKLYKFIERMACRMYVPKKGDVIVDIGAGIGTEALFFNEKTENEGKIYAIEASKNSCQKLTQLCEKNNLKNFKNFNLAITNSNQKVWIEETEDYQKDFINTSKKGLPVDGVTIDHFVEQNGINHIDFIKVNIEGAELQMIEGMKNTIKITKNIAISCHDFLFDNKTQIKENVVQFLEEHNFDVSLNNTGREVVDSWVYGKMTQ